MSIKANSTNNQQYWRSIDELDYTPEFEDYLKHEFAEAADIFPENLSRRRWLQIMGASLTLAGLSGCRFENEKIEPFAFRPANRVPGQTQQFSTTIEWGGTTRPLMGTSYDGRPIKLDGNPDHPLSLGRSDVFSQSCILTLYDPDRSRGLRKMGDEKRPSWEVFLSAFESFQKEDWIDATGKGFAVLAEPSRSPSAQKMREALVKKFPGTQWYEYESLSQDNERVGLQQAFGKPVLPQYDFEKAKIVLCLDADPLFGHPTVIRNARQWSAARDADQDKMSRVYAIESRYSLTGANADHRWPMKSRDIAGLAGALAAEIKKRKSVNGEVDSSLPLPDKRLALIAKDLVDHEGASLILAGACQPPEVHALVAQLNSELENDGQTVSYIVDPQGDRPTSLAAIRDLAAKIEAGQVTSLLTIGCNPVYDAPAELSFADLLKNLKSKIHFGMYEDETALLCDWHLNQAHPLEVWGDTIAHDGSWCIQQPLIEPLFAAKSATELLANLAGEKETSGAEIVKVSAADKLQGSSWEQAVQAGYVANSQPQALQLEAKDIAASFAQDDGWKTKTPLENGLLELVFTPSHSVYDGRFANNGWLQELPDPITKMTWGNVALMSPQTAKELGTKQNGLVRLKVGRESLLLPVYIQPGQAFGSISVAVGYGRKNAGFVGGSEKFKIAPVGVDVSPIRMIESWDVVKELTALSISGEETLAITQNHHAIDLTGLKEIERRWKVLIEEGTFDSYRKFREEHKDELVSHEGHEHPAEDSGGEASESHGHRLHWPESEFAHEEEGEGKERDLPGQSNRAYSEEVRWGMSIDLNKCVGCNACVTACQAENNIPVVGADQVKRGRELHWIRVDRYLASKDSYRNPVDDPEPKIVTQPVTCQMCETAPCETVCPVAATVHSTDGLNLMVYNRCIGTRYCGNNCPFKVRRFNYFNYSEAQTFIKYPWEDKRGAEAPSDRSLQNMVMNPEVTIRSRGVMEKCTYCIQRIQNTKILARNQEREIGPDEIQTACQQACPSLAIEFGNISVKESRVHKAHQNPRAYRMLDYLNLGQRTVYLARVRNPNEKWPELVGDSPPDGEDETKLIS